MCFWELSFRYEFVIFDSVKSYFIQYAIYFVDTFFLSAFLSIFFLEFSYHSVTYCVVNLV